MGRKSGAQRYEQGGARGKERQSLGPCVLGKFMWRPSRPRRFQAQEKPERDEQPENAPAGMVSASDEIRKLEAEMIFLRLALPHPGQVISGSAWEEEVIIHSKRVLHS